MVERLHDEGGQVQFRCDVSYIDDRAVVLVQGDVDLATAPTFLREVRATLALPIAGVAVDLGGVTFMDSSGINVLVKTRREATERSITFTLGAVPEQARLVLDVAGLAETFGLVAHSKHAVPPAP